MRSHATDLSAVAKITRALVRFRRDQRGTIAVMMALLFPALIAILGLGMEVTNWYMRTRAMQNAADAAVIAAASNATTNYNVEAAAVAANYGFVNGANNVTITATDSAACPADPDVTPPCYKVTITSIVTLALTEVIGYKGNLVVDGARLQQLSSAATATKTVIQQPICLLGLDPTGQAVTSNGAPNADFSGCTVMSNSGSSCNGSDLKAFMGVAHATNNGCGVRQHSYAPPVADPYAALASNIPSDLATKCGNSYPQESKQGGNWIGGAPPWSGQKTLTGTADIAGNTLICGDLRLTGDVTIDAPDGAVLYIQNGRLDLQGHTFRTKNGSELAIVFTGDNGGPYQHIVTDKTGSTTGLLDIVAPLSGPFSGVAIYQDPKLTTGVNLNYAGNDPTWDITGLVYMPNANVTISGAINKSTNGAVCFVMVAKDVTINGTGGIYAQSPAGAGCKDAGLNMPKVQIPGRPKLVY
jgi:Flp pilus assembly protein TadG